MPKRRRRRMVKRKRRLGAPVAGKDGEFPMFFLYICLKAFFTLGFGQAKQ